MYQALYRKWRPRVFNDIVGQDFLVNILKNQVVHNKLSHAYLFTGFKGTGKTTCAKILAKAVNCPNQKNGDPCNECEICRGIDNGSIMDVLEIDAASNNGVENIRELREEANFTPSVGKYRIYIIDEVHMLSMGAFNALLKIMEEPPSYVIFILATTEIHKIPSTIVSRCQRFDFKKISIQEIVDRLLFVTNQEKCNLQDDGAKIIARLSDGSMRDALSILDACISYSDNDSVDVDVISKVAALPNRDEIFDIISYLINRNYQKALKTVDKMLEKNINADNLCKQLIAEFRNIMIIKTIKGNYDDLNIDDNHRERLNDISNQVDLVEVFNIIDLLSECFNKMGKTLSKNFELEIALIKIMSEYKKQIVDSNKLNTNSIEKNDNIDMLYSRIKMLENKIDSMKSIRKNIDIKSYINDDVVDNQNLLYENIKKIDNWNNILDILSKINPALKAALNDSEGYVNEDLSIVLIDTKNQFFLDLIRTSKQAKQTLKEAILNVLGKKYRIGPYSRVNENKQPNNVLDEIEKEAIKEGIIPEIK